MTILSSPPFRPAALYLLLALPLAACALPKDTMNKHPAETKQSVASEHREKYRRNPNPTQRYDITLRIADAPGPLESIRGSAYYEAPDCTFVIDEIAGVYGHPDYKISVDFKRVDGHTYVGTVYADAMLNEDYFGKGICDWQISSANVEMKATGGKDEAAFISSLMQEQILQQAEVPLYFQKKFYPRDLDIANMAIYGRADRASMKAGISNQDLFTVTLSAKQVR